MSALNCEAQRLTDWVNHWDFQGISKKCLSIEITPYLILENDFFGYLGDTARTIKWIESSSYFT